MMHTNPSYHTASLLNKQYNTSRFFEHFTVSLATTKTICQLCMIPVNRDEHDKDLSTSTI